MIKAYNRRVIMAGVKKELLFDKTVIAKYVCNQIEPLISNSISGLIIITGLKGTGKTAVLTELYSRYGYLNDYDVEKRECTGVTSELRMMKIASILRDAPGKSKRLFLLDDVQNIRNIRGLNFSECPNVLFIVTADEFTASALEMNGNSVIQVFDITQLSYPLFKQAYRGEATIDTYIENMGSICCAVDSTDYLAKGMDLFLYNRQNLKMHNYEFMRDISNLISHEFVYMFNSLTEGIDLKSQRKYTALKRRYMCEVNEGNTDFAVTHDLFREVSLYVEVGALVPLFGSQVCRFLVTEKSDVVTDGYAQLTQEVNRVIYERLYKLLVLFELYRKFGILSVYKKDTEFDVIIDKRYAVTVKERSYTIRDVEPIEGELRVIVVYGGETTVEKGVQYINYVDYFEDCSRFFNK